MPASATAFARPSAVRARRSETVGALLDGLSAVGVGKFLDVVLSEPSRLSTGGGFRRTSDALVEILTTAGYSVSREAVPVGDGQSSNVIADRAGTGIDRRLVVVTAHLDSVNHEDGPDAPAPGADDNGSGAAGLMELARILATRTWSNDVRLILFGGEEQGLFGSIAHVANLSAAGRDRIAAVVNMDMIGRTNTERPGVLLEGAPVSSWLIDALSSAAALWTDLEVAMSLSPFASDHVPFIDAGIPAVLTIEGNDGANTDVHSARDVRATLDPALMMEILRMNAAVLAELLDDSGAPR